MTISAENKLRYKCLIFDHDDTSVSSTAEIHYPAHKAGLEELKPGAEVCSLEDWFRYNHEPGVVQYLKGVFGTKLDGTPVPEDEYKKIMDREMAIWREYMAAKKPHFYRGILEGMTKFREMGGIVTVVSLSPKDVIETHYEDQAFKPDCIYGWIDDKSKNKPHPFPTLSIMEKYNLKPEDCLVIDDLSPGIKMATSAGVKSAAACWCHKGLVKEMQEGGASEVFYSIEEFWQHVFQDDAIVKSIMSGNSDGKAEAAL